MLIFEEHFLDNRHNWTQKSTEKIDLFILNFYLLFRHKRLQGFWAFWKKIGENLYEKEYFHIQVMLEQSANSKIPKCEWYGAIWGVLDVDNFYSFLIRDDGYYQINKRENGNWSCYTETTVQHESICSGDALNVLEIRRNHDVVEFYINSELVHKLPAQSVMKVSSPVTPGGHNRPERTSGSVTPAGHKRRVGHPCRAKPAGRSPLPGITSGLVTPAGHNRPERTSGSVTPAEHNRPELTGGSFTPAEHNRP
ncbi:MAG: hypothetical protein AAGF26_07005, partial [Cyanobacteria bacterium P01_G01_bin.49]